MPLSPSVAVDMCALGYDAVHASQVGLSRAADDEIVRFAILENRIIVSMDLDFGTLLALSNAGRPGVILFRITTPSNERCFASLKQLLSAYPAKVLAGSVTVVEDLRIRTRKLPI